MIYLWILASYLLGSLPFGIIIAQGCKGIDPRAAGSGNPGATNVARLCGLPWGGSDAGLRSAQGPARGLGIPQAHA